MPEVKNLSKEDIPTTAADGSTINLAAGESKEMSNVDAATMLRVHGDEVIEIEGKEKEDEGEGGEGEEGTEENEKKDEEKEEKQDEGSPNEGSEE